MEAVATKYLTVPLKDKGLGFEEPTAGKYIGLYGGSFNPPHAGHLLVAQTAIERLSLDGVWWLVSPGNPLKDNTNLAPLDARIRACEELIDNPSIKVSAFEQTLGMKNSAAMLDKIVHANPKTHFVWIMGADNLANFHHWQDWQQIMATLPLAVIDRPNYSQADQSPAAKKFAKARLAEDRAEGVALQNAPAWVFIHGEHSHLSSTKLRQKQQNAVKNKAG